MILDIHSDVVIDVHERRQAGERGVLASRHLPKWRSGSVVGAVCVVGGDASVLCPHGLDRSYEGALTLLEAIEADIAESDGAIEVARSSADIRRLTQTGTFAIVLGLEGAMPIGTELRRLAELYERGLRVVGLTWNSKNALATGVGCGSEGLTELGARAVQLMNGLGMVVDLAHASPATYWDVLDASEAPVLVSHANARALCDHVRNLDDEQLAGLRAKGGVVGAVLWPDFVAGGTPTPEDVLDQIAYLIDAVGEGGVAIGADFIDYCGPDVLAALFPGVPDPQLPAFPVGLEDTSTLGTLLDGLTSRGFARRVVEGVAAESFLRLVEDIEGAVR